MRPSFWLTAALSTAYAVATPTRTVQKRWPQAFASVANGDFSLNGSKFAFVGTNAYWLPHLNSDEDISNTLANMSASGITVVRTWAFNDVTSIPDAGSWLQLIQNGTTTINNGTNGLQRLDKVVELAEQHGIYVLLSLTNNWNPVANVTAPTPAKRDDAAPTASPLPRNFLSNDYGGMDAYVREFGADKTHDEFYIDPTIRAFFEKYVSAVVTRFVNNPRVFGWELANDPRCNSTLPTADTCNTNTITQWHADVSKFIRSIDPNHLVSSGDHGFFCPSCKKLFPLTPAPVASPAAGAATTRRKSRANVMTKARLLKKIAEERRAAPRSADAQGGVKIRGRWTASGEAKRQNAGGIGSAFDGSSGVDSQDILNTPDIGFGSFQLLPDQNNYGTNPTAAITPPSQDFNATLQQGISWIQAQAASAQAVGKPLTLTAFGLVTQANLPVFVPFANTTPINPGAGTVTKRQDAGTLGVGVTDQQRDDAYTAWLNAAIEAGVQGILQYQWSSQGLLPLNGTLVQNPTEQQQTAAGGGTLPQSPNDGYGTLGQGQIQEQGILQTASQNISEILHP